jgi:hypothetical protein
MDMQRDKTWWDRNWKWFVPVGCLSGLTFLGGLVGTILIFVFSLMKSSDAYKLAFARAQRNPAVVNALGEPLKGGLFVSGNVNVNGPSGRADLSIPIAGPKGSGTIYIKATKSMGQWSFDQLVVQVERTGERVDLLGEKPE